MEKWKAGASGGEGLSGGEAAVGIQAMVVAVVVPAVVWRIDSSVSRRRLAHTRLVTGPTIVASSGYDYGKRNGGRNTVGATDTARDGSKAMRCGH